MGVSVLSDRSGDIPHGPMWASAPTVKDERVLPCMIHKKANSKTPGTEIPGVLLLEIEREERREESIRKTKGKGFISLCSAFVPLSYRETVKGI